jgi:hypothetical protein
MIAGAPGRARPRPFLARVIFRASSAEVTATDSTAASPQKAAPGGRFPGSDEALSREAPVVDWPFQGP